MLLKLVLKSVMPDKADMLTPGVEPLGLPLASTPSVR